MIFRIETDDRQYYGHSHDKERAIEIVNEAVSLPDVEHGFVVKKLPQEYLYDLNYHGEVVYKCQ